MLLTSVILILQEMLEASLILSVLLAFSVHRSIPRTWAWWGLALGIACACLYAGQVNTVSEWFDFVGMEVVNAAIQFAICTALLLFAALRLVDARHPLGPRVWQLLMTLLVALAIAREGFEILLYGSGFIGDDQLWATVLAGSLLGAGIGLSAGALLYYMLIGSGGATGQRLLLIFLAIFAGNMASQGTLLLIQADWLPSGQALWDTSTLVAEDTLLGQVLYATVGYEATPTALQAGAYGLLAATLLLLFGLRWPRADSATSGP